MALVGEFANVESGSRNLHKPVLCGWRFFDVEGRKVLQLDTYGSADRQLPGKVSQTVQIDRERAAELIDILRQAFPGL